MPQLPMCCNMLATVGLLWVCVSSRLHIHLLLQTTWGLHNVEESLTEWHNSHDGSHHPGSCEPFVKKVIHIFMNAYDGFSELGETIVGHCT